MRALRHTRAPQDTRPGGILAAEEGRCGRSERPRRWWAPKPLRPTVPRQVVRQLVSVVAAACAPLGPLTSVLLPLANTGLLTLFLAQVAQEVAASFVLRLVGRAGWPTTPRVLVPENLRSLPPPARSPALHPAEHRWEDLRGEELATRSFPALRPLETALCEGLTHRAAAPERVRPLTDFPYVRVTF